MIGRPMTLLEQLQAALAGRYDLDREIGAGGMAMVFLASDRRLGRLVALKVLKPGLAGIIGPDRFLREIAVGARLTHPHIIPVFDSGEADGLLWYTMPYVAGESLADRLARMGPLPVEDAIRFGVEVAKAIEYAHRLGVIHRDIKPDNILIHEEQALVADFGIALVVGDTDQDRLTSTGISIGTPRYMSPEQASGDRRIDHRTDLYSLGTVLYEMLTGEPPFAGGSLQSQIARIMTERAVPIRALRATVPEAIERVVDKALAKVPADRFQSGAELATALQGGSGAPAPSHRWRAWQVAGALLLAGVVIVATLQRRGPATQPTAGAAREERQLTATGDAWAVARAPDGQRAVYIGDSSRALMLLDLRSGVTRELARISSGQYNRWIPPQWDRTGRRVLVHGSGSASGAYGYYLVDPVTGHQELLASTNASFVFGTDDSSFVATYEGAMYLGPNPTTFQIVGPSLVGDGRLIDLRREYTFISLPRVHPTGRWIAFLGKRASGNVDLAVVGADGRDHQTLVPNLGRIESQMDDWVGRPEWSADGTRIFFPRPQGLGWSLWSAEFDPASGRLRSTPHPLAERLPGFLGFGIGADGTLLYSGGFPQAHLYRLRLTRNGWEADRPLTTGTALATAPAVSPDGQRIAYLRSGLDGRSDIFVLGIDGGQELRVTSTAAEKGPPAWAPEGQRIAYVERGDSGFAPMILDLATGAARPASREVASLSGLPPVWTPDGRQLLFQLPSHRNYQVVDLTTGQERRLVANDSVGWLFAPLFHGSGTELVVYWHRPPRMELWRLRLSDSSQTRIPGTQSSSGDVYPLRWRSDGVLEMEQDDMDGAARWVIRVEPRSGRRLRQDPVRLNCQGLALIDDTTAVCPVLTMQSDVWLSRMPH